MRLMYLDLLRSLAIIWMIIFHAAYDLHLFGLAQINFRSGFWYGFPRVIAFTFLFCVGVSLKLSHAKGLKWSHIKKRAIKLGFGALGVSIVTYFLFPKQWIFFGTLHCIFSGSLLGLFFINRPFLSWITMILFMLGQYLFHFDIRWVSSHFSIRSMDFIPLYPWFWTILLGINSTSLMKLLEKKLPYQKPHQIIKFLSQHSLAIYLIHQPLIYGLLWSYLYLKRHLF